MLVSRLVAEVPKTRSAQVNKTSVVQCLHAPRLCLFQFPTISISNCCFWFAAISSLLLNLGDHSGAVDNGPKDAMPSIQPRACNGGDEELATVRVRSCSGHAEQERFGMLQLEVLIWETRTVNALSSGTVASIDKQVFTIELVGVYNICIEFFT